MTHHEIHIWECEICQFQSQQFPGTSYAAAPYAAARLKGWGYVYGLTIDAETGMVNQIDVCPNCLAKLREVATAIAEGDKSDGA